MEKNKLLENTIAIALTQVITYVLPLITLPYLSRVLGVEKFGLVFWAQACILYFLVLTEYGFNFSAVKEISIQSDDNKKVSEIFNSVMCVKLILVILSLILLTCIILLVPKFRAEWLLFYLTFFIVIGNAIYPIWFFQGIQHMKYVTFLNILTKSIFLILIFIFVKSPNDYMLVAFLNSMGFIVSGCIGICIAVKRFNLQLFIPNITSIKSEFKNSFEFFIANITRTIYTQTNSCILGFIASPALVGYYIAAEKISNAIHMLTAPVGTALYPYISKTKNVKLYKKIFTASAIFMITVIAFVWFFAKQFIIVFYGSDMMPAYKILRIFCYAVLCSSIWGLIGYPFVTAMGHSKIINMSFPIAAIVHLQLLAVLYFINKLNYISIAYLSIIPYFIMLLIAIFAIKKYGLWRCDSDK